MPLTLAPSPTIAQYQPTKPRKASRRNRSEADAVGLFGDRGNCAESKRVRCFIAVPLEAPALAGAQRLLASLRDQVPGVRWVHPEALHITVHFFGNITDEQVGSGLQAVMPVADDTPPLPAGLDGLGTFPPRGRTRVLWLGASKEMPMVGEICNALRDIFGVHHPAGGIWGAAEPGGTIALIAHAANSTAFKCTWRAQHTLPTQQRFGRTHRPVRR